MRIQGHFRASGIANDMGFLRGKLFRRLKWQPSNDNTTRTISDVIAHQQLTGHRGHKSARCVKKWLSSSTRVIINTDPPYYDNIGYADLSDFFYVWLRRSLNSVWPELFRRLTTPKAEELVATPYRHGGKDEAEAFFMKGMGEALNAMRKRRDR